MEKAAKIIRERKGQWKHCKRRQERNWEDIRIALKEQKTLRERESINSREKQADRHWKLKDRARESERYRAREEETEREKKKWMNERATRERGSERAESQKRKMREMRDNCKSELKGEQAK